MARVSNISFSLKSISPLKIYLFLLIVIPLLLYWQTTTFTFVQDDHLVYFNPESEYYQVDLDDFGAAWRLPDSGLYIPVTYSFWFGLKQLGYLLTGQHEFNPRLLHAVNVMLHLLNGLLVFALLRLILKLDLPSFLAAVFFLVHPLQVEAVAYVSEMRGLLAALLGFLSLYLYLMWNQRRPGSGSFLYLGSLLAFLLAVLAKPSAMVIPVFMIILNRFSYPVSKSWKARGLIPYLAIMIFPVAMLLRSPDPALYTAPAVPLLLRPFLWLDSINFYLYKIFFPLSLAASYARTPEFLKTQWWLYLEWIIPAALLAYFWWKRKAAPLWLTALLLFIAGYLPVSNLLPFVFQNWSTTADRYLYLPFLGISLATGYALIRLQKYGVAKYIFILILAVLALRSALVQIPVWQNDLTLWDHCIKVTPAEDKAYFNRANEYARRNQLVAALEDYSRAIGLNPDFAEAYLKRGEIYLDSQDLQRALIDFNLALKMAPGNATAYFNRSRTWIELDRPQLAIDDLSASIELNPGYVAAYNNRGNLYARLQKFKQALSDYNRVLELDPAHPETYNNRANIQATLQNYEEALADYTRSLELDPFYKDALANRAYLYYLLKNFTLALQDLQQVQSLGGRVNQQLLADIKQNIRGINE